MASYYKASCKLIDPARYVDDDDPRRREHKDIEHPAHRCSMRRLSATASITALGRVSLDGWTCRLHSELEILPEWRIKVKRDNEAEYREYVIRAVSDNLHKTLTLEG